MWNTIYFQHNYGGNIYIYLFIAQPIILTSVSVSVLTHLLKSGVPMTHVYKGELSVSTIALWFFFPFLVRGSEMLL